MSSKRKATCDPPRPPKLAREAHSDSCTQPAAAGIASIHVLPPELLCMIFAYFPLRPRSLLRVSLVCKQWRKLVLRSVRRVCAVKMHDPERWTRLLPCIEVLVIGADDLLWTVPQGLQRLDFRRGAGNSTRPIYDDDCCFAELVARNPRMLTSVSLEEHRHCRAVVPLLRSCHSTLREVCTCTYAYPFLQLMRYMLAQALVS